MEKEQGLKVIFEGTVYVHGEQEIRVFDEDNGWEVKKIREGHHKCRILDFRGWKPHQIMEGETWLDTAGNEILTDAVEQARAAYEDWRRDQNVEDHQCPSATGGDYSPSCPWNAPGMSVRDFI